jgi:uncharacterized protein involved in exopolysaccharide biosynthesis
MALSPITPRDRAQRLVDLATKTLRYWWLVLAFAVVGGGLSFGFAMMRPVSYQSWAVLFYQERIQSSLLQNREEQVQRNIGDRYRELLMARALLQQIIDDPKLNPFPGIDDPELAIDKLREQVRFEARGANAFRIVYADADRDRAKAVTEALTNLLKSKDEALRNEQAQATASFAIEQKDQAAVELRKRELALAEFLAKHPEFAQDANQQGEGASIRAIRNQKGTPTGNNRLYALERQRMRIQSRLAGPDGPVRPGVPSAERIAAETVVQDAKAELAAANKELEDALAKYTDKHPTVIKAQDRIAAAQLRLRQAQGAVARDNDAALAPATPADRSKLQKELATLEAQIADEQKRAGSADDAAADAATSWVVQLETQHADLRRAVNEQRERVESLSESVFRAQIDASQKLAEQGGRLSIVDPAFKPVRPSGPGKTIFLLAGVVLCVSLGLAMAVVLALIDDRLYRRADLDQLGVAVLAVIPPDPKGRA